MELSKALEEKILKEIKKLFTVVKSNKKLDKHDKQTAINNAYLYLLRKHFDGVINLEGDYNTYKGYMFLTVKNAINRKFEIDNQKKNNIYQITDNLIQYETYNYSSDFAKDLDIKQIKERIHTKLTPFQRAIFRWNMRGWSYNYLSTVFGISDSSISKYMNYIISLLKDEKIKNSNRKIEKALNLQDIQKQGC